MFKASLIEFVKKQCNNRKDTTEYNLKVSYLLIQARKDKELVAVVQSVCIYIFVLSRLCRSFDV